MSKILRKLEGMAGTNCSALVQNSQSLATTFTKEESVYLKLSLQAFTLIFKHADKADAEKVATHDIAEKYDEAHLQLGQRRLICFRLENNTLYISMIGQNQDVHKAQKVIRGAVNILSKVVNAASAHPPKV
ncbi:hypothetical protein [Neptunomonas qingdaonensis]|uniref:Roadblock/LAMTOR2 domain-containing protein n=1 Tax=Neptunomonas qingdaonensis TaxID=1045558 RepID=A0A1I2UJA3_9GAMM|nr:hypothetical protein [Neptunomonas qingdaonensis]SFG77110.1 hypothetical protein SAMN05216175_11354 [Neptunomonas qingdaonensis]